MVYDFNTGSIDNFGWEMLVEPLSNILGSGLDKINDTKHTIADMWQEYNDRKKAEAEALAMRKQAEAQQRLIGAKQKKQQMLIIGGIVAVAIIVILLIVLNR